MSKQPIFWGDDRGGNGPCSTRIAAFVASIVGVFALRKVLRRR